MRWDEHEDLYNLDLVSHLKNKHAVEHTEYKKERQKTVRLDECKTLWG